MKVLLTIKPLFPIQVRTPLLPDVQLMNLLLEMIVPLAGAPVVAPA